MRSTRHLSVIRGGAAGFLVVAAVMLSATVAAGTTTQPTGEGTVLVTRVDDPITPVIADHLRDGVERAERDGHAAFLVEMDTPGGLVTSMRDIVQDFLAAEVPVITYVTPSGARAASAGALIAWSSHVVAMAPGTTIGAATPVDIEGGEVSDKIVEDAAAFARAVAEERGRDVEVAADAVTEGQAHSDTEAIDRNVADLIVADRATLLAEVDGLEVTLGSGATTTIATDGAGTTDYDMSLFRQVLQFLANPNVAVIFMSVGVLGLIYELANPGIGAAGGLGAVFLLLGLFSLSVLPVNVVGVLLLVVAAALFVAELFAPGIGVAAAMGSAALLLSAFFLFDEEPPGLDVSLAAILPTVIVVGVLVVVAGRLALRARTGTPRSGVSLLIGREVTVARAEGTVGQVHVDGSWWTARSDAPMAADDVVRVVEVDGNTLHVEVFQREESS